MSNPSHPRVEFGSAPSADGVHTLDAGKCVAYQPEGAFLIDPDLVDSDLSAHEPSGSSVFAPDAVLEENGRTYHGYKEGKYFLPNDGLEQERLDLQHQMNLIALDGRLHLAPLIGDPPNVLDIATGTGIWALQFAEAHPNSSVIGTDLSLIQPSPRVQNCSFIREDAEDEWVFPFKFDYIHLKAVLTCFNDHKKVMQRAIDHLNPGGYIEYYDALWGVWSPDGTVEGTAIERWTQLTAEGAASVGRDLNQGRFYKDWMVELGLVDVISVPIPVPGNSWPAQKKFKTIGRYTLEDMLMGLDGVSRKMLVMAGLSPSQIQDFLDAVKRDMADTSIHWCFPGLVVYGRKPFDGEITRPAATMV